MFLHNDYGSQFLYLLSGGNQGIKKNLGTFAEYAYIPRMETVLDSKAG